ncbi:DMT family transporter [Oceanospirillum sediminis]|uniref:DMT family transporter n=1 Tax=Oceanospirillum sediminis TaxID=2760088 RepID=A0A839IR64_9GAMM|nr:DMT family transporter [Oceanospirillum sediminis]MBB1487411.1 DMT family transporter [Oceanospirillum sediminis]
MIAKRLDTLAISILTLLCMVFGLQQIAVKLTLPDISPVMQAGLRSVAATFLLVAWMKYKGETIFQRDHAEFWGIIAGLLFAGEFLVLYMALEYTGAARATIFLYTSPFIVALGAQLFIPGERMRMIHIAGLIAAFMGIVLAFSDSLFSPDSNLSETITGDLLALLAALMWGATTVVIKATPQSQLSPSRVLLYQLAISAITLPIASVIMGEDGVRQVTLNSGLGMLFQVVIVAFVSYLTWFWLIRHYQASKIATFSFMTPMFGVFFAWLILGESISLSFALALLLVASGIYMVNRN